MNREKHSLIQLYHSPENQAREDSMVRREFIGALGAAASSGVLASGVTAGRTRSTATTGVDEWRSHFPSLAQRINGRPLNYLDTAATSLRPRPVIDAISAFYSGDNANPGGALHTLARRANERYEGARGTVARFINAAEPGEVVFTRGTTDGINLVAAAWGGANLKRGDRIVLGRAEHASNMAPWQLIAKHTGAEVVYFGFDEVGRPRLDELKRLLTPRTKVVAFSHVSNVLGMVNPVKEMSAIARAPGRMVLVDGAQSAPHLPVDVRDIGCDAFAFSSHKMLGPMGVGVLWIRRELLDAMPPYQGGSNMAHDVDIDSMNLSEGALKFGAGTPNVSGPVGLAAAMDFIRSIGFDAIREHELAITRRMLTRLGRVRGLRMIGSTDAADRVSVFAFALEGKTPAEVLAFADQRGICIRAGDLAALPLLKVFGVTRAARASAYLYTTEGEVDSFADALEELAGSR
jgi:cysteine desulfurase/selenocysteine lyase